MTLHHPNGQSYPLSFYGDTENGQTTGAFTWDAETPECPKCQQPIVDDRHRAPVWSVNAGSIRIVCECGWEEELSA